jgi:hypothetical protein
VSPLSAVTVPLILPTLLVVSVVPLALATAVLLVL